MSKVFIWISSSDYYNSEAIKSAQSVRDCMPTTDCLLFTTNTHSTGDFVGAVIELKPRQYNLWYLDFVNYLTSTLPRLSNLGYDKVVYLDTDTYMCAPVPEIFDLLNTFELASVYAPARRISHTVEKISDCFPEFNTGVLAFKINEAVLELFDSWLEIYEAYPDLYGENDQAPLREVLYHWGGRFCAMPIEYNCRFGFGGQARGQIKILHGRSDNMAALARDINASDEIRGWRRGDFK